MSPLRRSGLVVVGLMAAFAGGYFVKNVPTLTVSAPQMVAEKSAKKYPSAATAAPTRMTASKHTIDFPAVARREKPDVPPVPIIDFDKRESPPANAVPDESDPAFQLIKRQFDIKTTVLGDPQPVLPVLAQAKNNESPPTPEPMLGPTPRLDMPPFPNNSLDPPPPPNAPPVKHTKLVNSRAITFDFEVTKTGTSKVTATELWTTRDGGKTWQRTDRMDGCQSPFRTRLGSEGEYGFRLVFESESGMRSPEPKPGQAPEICMQLDTTPPKISLLPPEPADTPGSVLIRWSRSDSTDAGSVQLEYSNDGESWQSIDKVAYRTGQYKWSVPPDVPSQVFLRLIAEDDAGNVAIAQSGKKVVVDLVAPEGKLTGVRTEPVEPEVGPMPRLVECPVSVLPLPVGVLLRALAPVLMNSPGLNTNVTDFDVGMMFSDEEKNSVNAANEWLRRVVGGESLGQVDCQDPFDVVSAVLQTHAPEAIVACRSMGLTRWVKSEVDPNSLPIRMRIGAYSGGRSLVDLLMMPDWTPSTATPESYQPWEYQPEDPMWFWGSFPESLHFCF
jgi:hypothetical protein